MPQEKISRYAGCRTGSYPLPIGVVPEVRAAAHEVVLVAPESGAGGVGVVLLSFPESSFRKNKMLSELLLALKQYLIRT